jgi:hypothetical protein
VELTLTTAPATGVTPGGKDWLKAFDAELVTIVVVRRATEYREKRM